MALQDKSLKILQEHVDRIGNEKKAVLRDIANLDRQINNLTAERNRLQVILDDMSDTARKIDQDIKADVIKG